MLTTIEVTIDKTGHLHCVESGQTIKPGRSCSTVELTCGRVRGGIFYEYVFIELVLYQILTVLFALFMQNSI